MIRFNNYNQTFFKKSLIYFSNFTRKIFKGDRLKRISIKLDKLITKLAIKKKKKL